jgi:hypothetical protein
MIFLSTPQPRKKIRETFSNFFFQCKFNYTRKTLRDIFFCMIGGEKELWGWEEKSSRKYCCFVSKSPIASQTLFVYSGLLRYHQTMFLFAPPAFPARL